MNFPCIASRPVGLPRWRPTVVPKAPTLGRGRPPATPKVGGPETDAGAHARCTAACGVEGSYTPLARRLNEHDRLSAYFNPLAARDGAGPTPRARSWHGPSNGVLGGVSRSIGIALRTRSGPPSMAFSAHASGQRRPERAGFCQSLPPQGTSSDTCPRTQRATREVIS